MSETHAAATETKKRQMAFAVLDDGTIQATFGEGIDPLTLSPADVPETVQRAAISEGLISRARAYTSKLQDEARTPEALRDAVAKAFSNLTSGIWKAEREASDGIPSFTIEIEAAWLFRKMKAESKGEPFEETIEQTAALWDSLTDDEVEERDGKKVVIKEGQKTQVKKLPRYQQARAQVQARRNAEKAAKLAKKADAAEAEAPM